MVPVRSTAVPAAGHKMRVEPDEGREGPTELTAIIEREGDGYVALCPEVDVASQGNTVQDARTNLQEALELFFEMASDSEIERRLRSEVYVTRVQVSSARHIRPRWAHSDGAGRQDRVAPRPYSNAERGTPD